jgi:hypothetical protein
MLTRGSLLSLSLIVAGSVCGAPRPARPTPPPAPVERALRAAHRDHVMQLLDKFADSTVDPAAAGQPFQIRARFHNGQVTPAEPGDGYYTYEEGKLRLILSPSDAAAGYGKPKRLVLRTGGRRVAQRSYVGQNGFGASARVSVERLEEDGLALLERPEGESSPYRSRIMPDIEDRLPKDTYWVEMALSGSQARALALDSEFVVEGALATFPEGGLAECRGTYSGATIDSPLELYGETCWVGAKVSRITFRRRSTGETMKAWTNPAPAQTPASARIAEPARARANLIGYLSDEDLAGLHAPVTFGVRLEIDASGRVSDCKPTVSSGNADAERRACEALKERARFTPARDVKGEPAPDSVVSELRLVPPTQ